MDKNSGTTKLSEKKEGLDDLRRIWMKFNFYHLTV